MTFIQTGEKNNGNAAHQPQRQQPMAEKSQEPN